MLFKLKTIRLQFKGQGRRSKLESGSGLIKTESEVWKTVTAPWLKTRPELETVNK